MSENWKRYYHENRSFLAEKKKAWMEANADRLREKRRQRYRENQPKFTLKAKLWRINNLPYRAAMENKRRAAKLNATPPWLTKEHYAQIRLFYEDAASKTKSGRAHTVDHIVPLQGKNVCGLHVPWNLRVIPASENFSKGNRFDADD